MLKYSTGNAENPSLSIVVVIYNMHREAPRTLYSLSGAFQVGTDPEDYEVVVVDNGSPKPLPDSAFEGLRGNFRYYHLADAAPSPAAAINFGVAQARAPNLGIMIDGARIASPGVVAQASAALAAFANPVVCTVGFHLGPEMQTKSPAMGYDTGVEDGLLASIKWRANGYRLFEISAPAGSSKEGWLGSIAESNLLFLPRSLFDRLGGFDERFDIPGGGLVNLDFYKRACELEGSTLISLLGEGTFHQIHGGIMSSRPHDDVHREIAIYRAQYEDIRGVPFTPSKRLAILFSQIEREFRPGLRQAGRLMGVDAGQEKGRSR